MVSRDGRDGISRKLSWDNESRKLFLTVADPAGPGT